MSSFVRRVSEIARGHAPRVATVTFHDARGRLARLLLDFSETAASRSSAASGSTSPSRSARWPA